MFLLVGLGNPGSEYAETRHNVGFMAVDEIVRRYSLNHFKDKFKGQIATGDIANNKVALLKPETYMNLSGESVLGACSFYKIKPDKIIVFHDDMDLPAGKVKVKIGGGSGGHNGIKSIDANIGVNYMRVRIGVGRPDNKSQVVNWVLTSFAEDDRKKIDNTLSQIAKNLPLLLEGNEQTFMNKIIR
jgi:PTH1 family peptidyl-tRNA hydrolase